MKPGANIYQLCGPRQVILLPSTSFFVCQIGNNNTYLRVVVSIQRVNVDKVSGQCLVMDKVSPIPLPPFPFLSIRSTALIIRGFLGETAQETVDSSTFHPTPCPDPGQVNISRVFCVFYWAPAGPGQETTVQSQRGPDAGNSHV